MYFCFRWLLIHFKREFDYPVLMRLWEVLYMLFVVVYLFVCLFVVYYWFSHNTCSNSFGINRVNIAILQESCDYHVILCNCHMMSCDLR